MSQKQLFLSWAIGFKMDRVKVENCPVVEWKCEMSARLKN